ncbi:hypothetical protein [Noviherbaspirillum autotrophicum]|uniref:Uncharacterized protein n=1 Tax=Noviherbaspirillum autotrophicum TaxID=709839 RepID=A0A0C2BNN6_9BURK|nr:hypothetical protein [Noviherbaspirillum autotrophicum]KIF81649.1 hypothetical protein TSA66_13980 [Noviherbaspirillum autotrophicum]KIF82010.1 hypothetical protein TSA66_16315 [Noviherbaspirillum autotrophicum]KIF84104.1 hypothetical protein TSA66_00720 [Noviherbaspirillum autotrophicum]
MHEIGIIDNQRQTLNRVVEAIFLEFGASRAKMLTMNKTSPARQSLIDLGRSLELVSIAICPPCSDVSLLGEMEVA